MVREKTAELEASNRQLAASLEQLSASQSDIRQARDFMERTFHCAIDGFLVVESRGSMSMANRASEQMLGDGPGELSGRIRSVLAAAQPV